MTTASQTQPIHVAFGYLQYVHETAYGHAARANRGRYTGGKIHRLIVGKVVGIEPGHEDEAANTASKNPQSIVANFLREQKKPEAERRAVHVHIWPACGCTQGQWAGAPHAQLTAQDVTCSKCAV